MPKVKLLLAIHSHQPVGNFEGVFQEAYEKSYLPFLETVARHPHIKMAFHYSGALLDWFAQKQPECIKKIKELVERGQLEILAAGYYEPILPIIPEQDALGQISMLRQRIKELFGYDATGAWLTERVWEPRTSCILAKSGIRFTIVDDSHFKFVGREPEELEGYFISEDQGLPVNIFPGSEKLRYLMPFRLPQETIDYLRVRLYKADRDIAITFADDGEKFGLWPGTHKWVYKEGWLENFLTLLEANRDWIETQTFSDYMHSNPATGKIYLTCASYREMLEWSEGYFRNFFIRYSESDAMHKKMFYVSNKLQNNAAKMPAQDAERARRYLYMGQANDAYWHGVFGGLYLNHLRSSVFSNLIEAEKIIDSAVAPAAVTEADINIDGNKEIILHAPEHTLVFSPRRQGSLLEWDYLPRSLNVTNTIMRRPEKYHEKLKEKMAAHPADDAGIPSIHDAPRVKDSNLVNELHYDRYPRFSLVEHYFDANPSLDAFATSQERELFAPASVESGYTVRGQAAAPGVAFTYALAKNGMVLDVEKSVRADKNISVAYTVRHRGQQKKPFVFGVEFNFAIYDPGLSNRRGSFTSASFTVNDVWYGLGIAMRFDTEALIWHYPIETVSESEAGIEKTYQGLCLVCLWDADFSQGDTWKTAFDFHVV